MPDTVVIAGASGVIGSAAVDAFSNAGWEVLALSRRKPAVPDGIAYRHVSLDLEDAAQCRSLIAESGGASHFVYAAVAEEPGLAAGWSNPQLIERNRQMFANVAEPLAASGALRWACLLQGTKAYGAHVHPIRLPAREDAPRDQHENFYFRQEDCLRELAARHGFSWTILRPQVVFGTAPGAAMNPVAAIGTYAALCREMDLPFAYPGNAGLMWEATDAFLLASAMLWATECKKAAGEIFNVTNGDVFVLRDDWTSLAKAMALPAGEARDTGLVEFLTRDETRAAWRELARKYGLVLDDLPVLLGQSHHYVDLLLDDRVIQAGGLPTLVSGIKIRKAGFGGCCDSLESFLCNLRRMTELRLLPPGLVRENRSLVHAASRKALAGNA